jgi:ribonuclease P protein component
MVIFVLLGVKAVKKEYRIKKNNEIETLLSQKKQVGNSSFSVYYSFNQKEPHFRFAISVPKKYGTAVDRNRIKRRIREVIKTANIREVVDFFIIVKIPAKPANYEDIYKSLTNLFARAKIIEG